jgi:sugar (pentulose or hexulose) kinase
MMRDVADHSDPTGGPASRPLVLAIDLGTSAIKAALLDESLGVVRRATRQQVVLSDSTGRREHRPADTLRLTRSAIAEVLADGPHRIEALAVSGPRGSFAVVDANGIPTTELITWQDTRAAAWAAEHDTWIEPGYRAVTGTSFDPAVVLPKLGWLRETRPELFRETWQIATPQSLVLAALGAEGQVCDRTVAAHVGLLDVRRREWSASLLRWFAIPAGALPTLVEPGTVVGQSSGAVAGRWRLPPGVPLIAAASDGVCSELGSGVVDPGQLYAYLGTASTLAGPIATVSAEVDPSLILMPGADPDVWRLLGLARAGGSGADWWRRIVGVRGHERIDGLVAASPPGAAGTLFIPTLAGAVAPVPDGRARGAFVGLSLGSTRGDLSRAVFEGIALELRWLLAAMDLAGSPAEVRLTGGGARSDAWAQIVADVFQAPIARVQAIDPGIRGAGAYAWAAIGRARSARSLAREHQPGLDGFQPRVAWAPLYRELADRYRAVRQAFELAGLDARLHATPAAADLPA